METDAVIRQCALDHARLLENHGDADILLTNAARIERYLLTGHPSQPAPDDRPAE